MSHKIEIIKKGASTLDRNNLFFDSDDISFNFDDDNEEDYSNDPLYEIEFLFRMVGSGDYKTYYILKSYEMEKKEISLFDLKQEFLEKNNHLCFNDCFLQFMFFVVMKKESQESYLKKRKIANLKTRKIIQLANSDEIFREKVEYIRISALERQDYPEYANHWDLKYADEKCCHDEHIQKLLFNCTTVHNVSSDFRYTNMLVS